MVYTHVSKGVKYYLHRKKRGKGYFYYFGKKKKAGACALPSGYKVMASKTGLPYLKKK